MLASKLPAVQDGRSEEPGETRVEAVAGDREVLLVAALRDYLGEIEASQRALIGMAREAIRIAAEVLADPQADRTSTERISGLS